MAGVVLVVAFSGCRSKSELLVEPASNDEVMDTSVGGNEQKSKSKPSRDAANAKKSEPSKSSDAAAIEPPVDRVTDGAVLPLPPGVSLYLVKKFMQEYEPAYKKHSTLLIEFEAVVATARDIPVAPDAEETPIGILVKQNFERSHWVFLIGVQDLLQYLQEASKRELAMDIERNFVDRMRGLVALAKELTASSNDEKYTAFARSLYLETSRRFFNRELRNREIQGPQDGGLEHAP